MTKKAIITSISGFKLTKNEFNLFSKFKPWGIILFKRNINSFKQTKNLIISIKKVMGDKNFPIMIDEEGGRVRRMSNFIDNKIFSQKFFGDLYKKNKSISLSIYKNYIFSLTAVLRKLGISIITVPVLDILNKNTNKIIGSRSYSNDKKIIYDLGKFCISSFKKKKIGNVIKHIPGHGSSKSDSHKVQPIIKKSLKQLIKDDFSCFKNMDAHFSMTAHILYSNLDKKYVATHSKHIIKNIIRSKIGFKGLIISDDISMKALKFDLLKNAISSLNAGCNLVLYCSGKYSESSKLLKQLPNVDNFTKKKHQNFINF